MKLGYGWLCSILGTLGKEKRGKEKEDYFVFV
jgi:hypothetical protein